MTFLCWVCRKSFLNLEICRFLAVPSSLIITKPDIVRRKGAPVHEPKTARTELRLGLPPNPPIVSISIIAPKVIGTCDTSITLNSVGAGNAGRPFVYNWTFISSSSQHSSAFINSVQQAVRSINGTPAYVATKSFLTGSTYKFKVQVANWLGITSSTTHVFRKDGGERVILSTVAQWYQTSGPSEVVIPQPTSAYLRLPAFVLDINSTYQFSMHASTKDSQGYAVGDTNVTFTVHISDEPVRAVISGGSERLVSLSAGPNITFEGGESVDPAYISSRLSFNWSLTNVANGNPLPLRAISSTAALVSTDILIANQTYLLELVTTSNASRWDRSGRTQQIIRTTDADIPFVSIRASSGLYHNVQTKLSLSAVLRNGNASKAGGGLGFGQQWSCTSANFNLSDSRNLLSGTTAENLVIRPNALAPGSTYSFAVRAWYSAEEGYQHGEASIVVKTNYPPVFGSCESSPQIGTAMTTVYRLSCDGWTTGTSLPLRYQFQMVTSRHTIAEVEAHEASLEKGASSDEPFFLDLCELRQVGYYQSVLSESSGLSNIVVIRARIVDDTGASSSFPFSLTVLPLPPSGLSTAEKTMNTRFSEGDMQEYVVLAAGISSQLNSGFQDPAPPPVHSATTLRMSMLRNLEDITISNGSNLARVLDPQTSSALVERITAANRSGEVDDGLFDLSMDVMTSIVRAQNQVNAEQTDLSLPQTAAQLSGSVANMLHAAKASRLDLPVNRSLAVANLLSNLSSMLVSGDQVVVGEEAVTAGSANSQDGSQRVTLSGKLIASTSLENATLAQKATNCKVVFQPSGRTIGGPNASSSSSVLQLGLTTIVGGKSSMFYETWPAGRESKNGILKIDVRSIDSQEIQIQNTSRPIRFTVPNWEAKRSTANEDLSRYGCAYWNGTHWSKRGLNLTMEQGAPVCESTHLSLFTLLTDSVSVEVNTVSANDLTDLDAFDPSKNPMMLLVVVVFATALLILPILRWYDRNPGMCAATLTDCRGSNKDSFEDIQRDFWRLKTTARYLHTEAKGSCRTWMRTSSIAMRTRHPWLSIALRHPGDYMNSQKRLLVLLVLVMNGAVVCALLEGTSQKLFFLTGTAALAIVACLISFPVPYVVSAMFYRATPKEFRVPFVASGLAAALPWIFFIASVCAQDVHDGLAMEDDEAEAEADGDDNFENDENGDDQGETQKQQDEVDGADDDDDDSDEEKGDGKKLDGKEAKSKRVKTKPGILPFQSSMVTHTGSAAGASLGWVAGGERKEQKIFKRSQSMRMHFQSTNTNFVTRSESFYGFASESSVGNNEWTTRDGVGILVSGVLILGCAFLLVVISWSRRMEGGQEALEVTVMCYGQDVLLRIFTIALAEGVLIAMLSFSTVQSITRADGGRALTTMVLPCDVATCFVDSRGIVDEVTAAGKRLGVRVGWSIVRINGEAVSSERERQAAVRRAHAMGSQFSVSFNVAPCRENARLDRLPSESISFHSGIDPEQDFPYQPPSPRRRLQFGRAAGSGYRTTRYSIVFDRAFSNGFIHVPFFIQF
eukprot:jgi/Bigna1/134236/aug1.24_g8944